MKSINISIIILCKTLNKGGAEKQAILLAGLLGHKGLEVTLVNWCDRKLDPGYADYITSNSINYKGLAGNLIGKFRSLITISKEREGCIILSYLTSANALATLAGIFNKKISAVSGIRSETLPFHKLVVERLIHNYLNTLTVFNSFSARDKFIADGFRPGSCIVIHNAIRTGKPKAKKRPAGTVRIISVARFVSQKDIGTALVSFKKLTELNSGKSFEYLLVGYGREESEIRMMIRRLDLEGRVSLLINPPDIPALLENSDIYLSTSLFEGLSNSIMEAMAAGLPVVATDVGDNRYLVEDSVNGFLVPCKESEMITKKLDYLVSSAEIRERYGENSHRKIIDEFSEERMVESYMDLIEKLSSD